MKRQCPDPECRRVVFPNHGRRYRLKGTYFRRSDGQHIRRYLCRVCLRSFSSACEFPNYRQKKRQLNHPLKMLLVSGVSQRRAALVLGVNRKTVVRKFRYLAERARSQQQDWFDSLRFGPMLNEIQFDDLETSEHTKCKPLSVTLAVEPKSRKILDFQVSAMPAKGLLAHKARAKYGPRKDLRPIGWNQMFRRLQPIVACDAVWTSDENPHYPRYLRRHHREAVHKTTPGGRGCVAGQGELKKLKFDPLFSLNHTCAMFRANLNRLFRRTWCTTKTKQGLIDHLSIYVAFHNQVLT